MLDAINAMVFFFSLSVILICFKELFLLLQNQNVVNTSLHVPVQEKACKRYFCSLSFSVNP